MAGLHHIESDTLIGTISGTLLSIAPQVFAFDMVKTMILAAVGAATSFLVAQFCKWLWRKIRKRP